MGSEPGLALCVRSIMMKDKQITYPQATEAQVNNNNNEQCQVQEEDGGGDDNQEVDLLNKTAKHYYIQAGEALVRMNEEQSSIPIVTNEELQNQVDPLSTDNINIFAHTPTSNLQTADSCLLHQQKENPSCQVNQHTTVRFEDSYTEYSEQSTDEINDDEDEIEIEDMKKQVGRVVSMIFSCNPSNNVQKEDTNEIPTSIWSETMKHKILKIIIDSLNSQNSKMRNRNKRCRVCLAEGSIIPIFGEILSEHFVTSLNHIGGIQTSATDPYPKYLCESCYAILQIAVLFRKTAQESEAYLKKTADSVPTQADQNISDSDAAVGNDNEPESLHEKSQKYKTLQEFIDFKHEKSSQYNTLQQCIDLNIPKLLKKQTETDLLPAKTMDSNIDTETEPTLLPENKIDSNIHQNKNAETELWGPKRLDCNIPKIMGIETKLPPATIKKIMNSILPKSNLTEMKPQPAKITKTINSGFGKVMNNNVMKKKPEPVKIKKIIIKKEKAMSSGALEVYNFVPVYENDHQKNEENSPKESSNKVTSIKPNSPQPIIDLSEENFIYVNDHQNNEENSLNESSNKVISIKPKSPQPIINVSKENKLVFKENLVHENDHQKTKENSAKESSNKVTSIKPKSPQPIINVSKENKLVFKENIKKYKEMLANSMPIYYLKSNAHQKTKESTSRTSNHISTNINPMSQQALIKDSENTIEQSKKENMSKNMPLHYFFPVYDLSSNSDPTNIIPVLRKPIIDEPLKHNIVKPRDWRTIGTCFKCEDCNLMYNLLEYIAHYKTKHPEQKKLKCPKCHKCYAINYFERHMHDHKSGPHMCDVCGKTFVSVQSFYMHIATHSKVLPFKCSHCPYRGRYQSSVRQHLKVHTGERPYLCQHCPRKFYNTGNLKKHIQAVHSKERDFECVTCKVKFVLKSELGNHIKTVHIGVKDQICGLCGKGFTHRSLLKRHQVVVHRKKKAKQGGVPLHIRFEQEKLAAAQS